VVVPAGTPRPIINKLHTDLTQTLQMPEVRERLAGTGVDLIGGTPQQLAAFIQSEIAKLGKVVKQSGARID
jgi:tripartite-type tricarboxylate transporter receptor subunit TctC